MIGRARQQTADPRADRHRRQAGDHGRIGGAIQALAAQGHLEEQLETVMKLASEREPGGGLNPN